MTSIFWLRWVRLTGLSGFIVFSLLLSGLVRAETFRAAQSSVRGVGASLTKRVFSFRIRGEPETLDWNRAHSPVEAALLMNLMEGLVSIDQQLRVVPALALNWQISKDQKTYTFKLRPGVFWSDGVELKAKDFVYSWRRLLSPLTAASYAYFLFDIEGAQAFHEGKYQSFDQVGVKALDDYVLEVRLARPVVHWISISAFWVTFPMRQDVVEEFGAAWDTPGHMVNLGPFSLASHEFDSKIILKANPNYYGTRGNLDAVEAYIVPDDAEAVALFETGKLDFLTDISGLNLDRIRKKNEFKVFNHLKTAYLGFVVDKYPISNLKLRKAIAMSLDRSQLVGPKSAFGKDLKVATSFVPPGMLGYSKSLGLAFNPSEARQILRSSGLNLRQSFSLDYILPDWDRAITVAHWVRDQLKKNLGIRVSPNPMENKRFRNQLDLYAAPLFDASWTADYPDPDNFLSVFLSSSGNSRSSWKDAQFDLLVDRARQEFDSKKREKIYLDLQRQIQEQDVVMVPLYYEPNLALVSSRAKNLQLNPLDFLYLRSVDVIP